MMTVWCSEECALEAVIKFGWDVNISSIRDNEEFDMCVGSLIILAKLYKENKTVFLLGDYNVDLSKYEQHSPNSEFLDFLASSMFLPYIIQPTRVASNSKFIINYIFSNVISTDIISGNLKAFAPDIFRNSTSSKSNYFERNWRKFNQDNFILDYFSINWKNTINLQKNDVDHSLQSFFDSVNDLLKIHAPYKKVEKYKLKFKEKPWINSGLQKPISIKNSTFKKYINTKDPHIKEENYIKNIEIIEILLLH